MAIRESANWLLLLSVVLISVPGSSLAERPTTTRVPLLTSAYSWTDNGGNTYDRFIWLDAAGRKKSVAIYREDRSIRVNRLYITESRSDDESIVAKRTLVQRESKTESRLLAELQELIDDALTKDQQESIAQGQSRELFNDDRTGYAASLLMDIKWYLSEEVGR